MISTTIRLAPTLASRQRQSLLALLPGILVLLAQQGAAALSTLLLALFCSLLGEMACLYLRKQPITLAWQQPACLLSAVLLTLLLPLNTAPLALAAACSAAILLRQLFGGSAHGPFHPVSVSLILLAPWLPLAAPADNLPLSLALLLGICWLGWRHLLAWQAPAGFGLVLLASLPLPHASLLLQPAWWLLAGWVISDSNSIPLTPKGRWLHGVAMGLSCLALSLSASRMDIAGALAASLLLSACAPLLDKLLLLPPTRT